MATPAPNSQPTAGSAGGSPVRVMVVDDSAVIRGLMKRWLAETPGVEVVGSSSNGAHAVATIGGLDPDVVVLDIEMPEMDGLSALPKLLEKQRDLKVVMASTLTLRNADISLKAMSLGASDYLAKPESAGGGHAAEEFRRELVEKVIALGTARAKARARRGGTSPAPAAPAARATATPAAAPAAPVAVQQISLRKQSSAQPRILAIGCSTGGPQALFKVFEKLGPAISKVPVVLTQHMPPAFTTLLAEKLGKISGRPSVEGVDGMVLEPGRIHIAPGDYHMRLEPGASSMAMPVIRLSQDAPVHFCRPAVDPMFESIAAIYKTATLAVILTGMGNDGRDGGRIIADAGGTVIAQDEATSVVWGMPGAAAQAGICAAVLPLDEVSDAIGRVLGGGRL